MSDPFIADAPRADHIKQLDRQLAERLSGFAGRHAGSQWLERVVDAYADDGNVDEAELMLAVPWGLYDCVDAIIGASPARAFLASPEYAGLSPQLARLLDANLSSWLSVWEVQDVAAGVGLAIRDLLTGQERFIHEVSGSRTANKRDAILMKVVDFDRICFAAAMHPQPLAPMDADAVVRDYRSLVSLSRKRPSMKLLRHPDRQLELMDLWRDQVQAARSRPAPQLTNTDGDVVQVTVDHFDIARGNKGFVLARLRSFPGAEAPEKADDGSTLIVVTKPGNAVHKGWSNTVIGQLFVTSGSLRIESNSTRRADALRRQLVAHLGTMVTHRQREEKDIAELRDISRVVGSPEPLPPAEAAAIAREYRQRYMIAWLDEPVPALAGLTPREAAARRKSRARASLVALLRNMERSEDLLPAAERIDIGVLRSELRI